MFHNTTHETGSNLLRFHAATERQDDQVLAFFRDRAGQTFTPSEARDVPLTSVRRAISNLTAERKLVKTTAKRIGVYGRHEWTWTYPMQGAQRVVGGDLLL